MYMVKEQETAEKEEMVRSDLTKDPSFKRYYSESKVSTPQPLVACYTWMNTAWLREEALCSLVSDSSISIIRSLS